MGDHSGIGVNGDLLIFLLFFRCVVEPVSFAHRLSATSACEKRRSPPCTLPKKGCRLLFLSTSSASIHYLVDSTAASLEAQINKKKKKTSEESSELAFGCTHLMCSTTTLALDRGALVRTCKQGRLRPLCCALCVSAFMEAGSSGGSVGVGTHSISSKELVSCFDQRKRCGKVCIGTRCVNSAND